MRQAEPVGQLLEQLVKLTNNDKLRWKLEGEINNSAYSAILGQYKMILPTGGHSFEICNIRNMSFCFPIYYTDTPLEIIISLFQAIHQQEKRLKKKSFHLMTSQEKQQCLSKLIAFVYNAQ